MTTEWGAAIIQALPALVLNPFTYILVLLMALHLRRQISIERKLFGTKLHAFGEELFYALGIGVLGGLLVSIPLVLLGVVLTYHTFVCLWLMALLLMAFRVRYLCFAYAGSILALLSLIAGWLPAPGPGWLAAAGDILRTISLPALFAMVALLHLAEALLIYLSRLRPATPVFMRSKRGRMVGAYELQHLWLVPLFLVTESGQGSLPPLFASWPLFAQQPELPLGLVLLPAVLGYSEQAVASTPEEKMRFSARWLTLYGLILLGLSLAAVYLDWFIWLALLFAYLGHEALIVYSRYREESRAPIHVHPHRGLKILAVIPRSPAAKMGLRAGDVIVKVNGMPVRQRQALYEALSRNKAFCRLEVINPDGEVKFAQSSVYEHDHHQLGIVLAPDEEVPYYIERQDISQDISLIRLMGMPFKRNAQLTRTVGEEQEHA
ncbi:PDZ domain-containing protein [Caldalkalibacillus thermarum]|nr:PDZ domain-containing protein [Caldalkalibacillus thermarum]